VIFAGANDGMLHAFLDSDGSELWGFIPPVLLDKLKLLGGDSLEYFVDGAPAAAVIDNDRDGTIEPEEGDQVILVFGLRRGGSHYYALDVTDPYSPQFLWQIGPDQTDFSEIGQSWATPVFGRIRYGNTLAVFLSGGYDPAQDYDPTGGDAMGRGIYVVDLLTGMLIKRFTNDENPDIAWSIPSDIAAVDTSDNGLIDRAYVGDMRGRLWRFDMTSPDPSSWSSEILFHANSPIDGTRKIFYPPDVLFEEGYEMVIFGTGDRANPNKDAVINRIYSVKDKGSGIPLDESYLVDVTDDLLQDPYTPETDKATLRNELNSGHGWYIRLVDNLGEKVLAPPLTFFGTAYVTTHTPAQLPLADPCSPHQGTARLYALNYKTGEATLNFDTANDDGDSEVLERGDRYIGIGGSIPSMMVIAMIEDDASGLVGVSGGIFKTGLSSYTPILRIYWRQLF
jgi:type IV pilus assembly protein PilY1